MTKQRAEIVIDANGLARTEQTFKLLNKYMERLQRQVDKLGRMRANPMIELIDHATPQLEKIGRWLDKLNGQSRSPLVFTINKLEKIPQGASEKKPIKTSETSLSNKGYENLTSAFTLAKRFGEKVIDLFDPNRLFSKNDDEKSQLERINSVVGQVIQKLGFVVEGAEITESIRDYRNRLRHPDVPMGRVDSALNSGVADDAFKLFKFVGKFLKYADYVSKGVEIYTAPPEKRLDKSIEVGGSLAGSGLLGAYGMALGSAISPGIGTAIGGILFSYIGDYIGDDYAKHIVEGIKDMEWKDLYTPIDWSDTEKVEKAMTLNKDLGKKIWSDIEGISNSLRTDPEEIFEAAQRFQEFKDTVSEKFDSTINWWKNTPSAVGNYAEELPSKFIERILPQWALRPFGLTSYYEGETKTEPLVWQGSGVQSSTANNAVYLAMPPGAVQLTVQDSELNYEELSNIVGNKIATAMKQVMTNKPTTAQV